MPKIDAIERHSDATDNGRLPIVYYTALDREIDIDAEERGWEPSELRKASEMAVRTRHHEAEITHESHKACGRQPDIWELSLGNISVAYTIEPHAVVIRGYVWEFDPESLDEHEEAGRIYWEYEWTLPA